MKEPLIKNENHLKELELMLRTDWIEAHFDGDYSGSP